jgi:hypothetical protein
MIGWRREMQEIRQHSQMEPAILAGLLPIEQSIQQGVNQIVQLCLSK